MKTWNLTGIYKASRDRMPAKRSRRIGTVIPAHARIVMAPMDLECDKCGFGLTTNAHRIFCSDGDEEQ